MKALGNFVDLEKLHYSPRCNVILGKLSCSAFSYQTKLQKLYVCFQLISMLLIQGQVDTRSSSSINTQ